MGSHITFTEANLEMLLDDLGDYSLERIQLVSALVQQSDVLALIEKWRAEDHPASNGSGRPAAVSVHAALVLMFMLALENKALLLTTMTSIVTRKMTDETRDFLSILELEGTYDNWYHRIQRTFQTALRPIDPFPIYSSRNKRMNAEEWSEVLVSRDPLECAMKQERLDLVINSLLDATWQGLPREIRKNWKGNTSVDATAMRAFGQRGNNKYNGLMGIEPDAGWWVRLGDHKDDGKQKRKLFGWDVHLAVTVGNNADDDLDFPILALGMAVGKPGTEVAENTVKVYESMHGRGYPSGLIVADMAYFAGQRAQKLHLPLAAIGHRPVTDYKTTQMGAFDQYQGARLVEGQLYCPTMPETLVTATKDYHDGTSTELVWRQRIAQRVRYAFKPKGKPDAQGYARMSHPTVKARAICSGSRKDAPQCCKQVTITVTPEFFSSYMQPLTFGSDEHIQMYGHGRNCVETFNAYVKDESKQALGTQNRRRLRGYTAQTLMAAFLVAAANVRKIYMFMKQRRLDSTAFLADPKKKREKRRKSNIQYYRNYSGRSSKGSAPPKE